ncbi:recombinase family protein [Metabacillus sediminilitoris]|nr:recombinase family protein [Metabacillus sediminilitoris]
MLEELESGDTVIIREISRISRSTKDLLTIVETIK